MVSFSVFILTISYVVKLFGLDPDVIRLFAVIILVIMGLSMIIPALAQVLEGTLSRLSGRFGQTQIRSGFGGGFLTGCSLGIVWTPCTGPILATIATLAATTSLNLGIILVTIFYVIGLGIPLFFFSYGGGKLIAKTRFVGGFTGRIQQLFGVVILLTALAIYTNYDKVIQVTLLDSFPSYTRFLIGLETNPAVKAQLDILKRNKEKKTDDMIGKPFTMTDSKSLPNLGPAPEFVGITKWLNTDRPLTLQELRGKVVLVDIWTYTCINCIRTLPYLTRWYEKYKDQGFVIVGVHSPEFEFEKKTENVLNAIKRYTITYPVAQDNDFATWKAYNNQYWPAKYLIDAKGNIRYTHFGEGNYDETETKIQELLKESGALTEQIPVNNPTYTIQSRTPEIYLGNWRIANFTSPEPIIQDVATNYSIPKNFTRNTFAYGGLWTVGYQYAMPTAQTRLVVRFDSAEVFLVMRPKSNGLIGSMRVLLDGKLLSGENAGTDTTNGIVIIDTDRLYKLIKLPEGGIHTLELEFFDGNIELYAFTFG